MVKIGLLSDTHGYLDDAILNHLKDVDEVWHAGDFGNLRVLKQLEDYKPLRSVWGNIDDEKIRNKVPEINRFTIEEVGVFMIHIGGYPGRYAKGVKDVLLAEKPKLFISGHSHILKVMFDKELSCLHINPGAAGKHGWHTVRTLVRFTIDGLTIGNCEVIEMKPR